MRKCVLTAKQDRLSLHPDNLRRWRDGHGWTQKQAAAWLNVDLRAYQKWEQGYREAHNPGPILARMRQARPKGRPDQENQQGALPLTRQRQAKKRA